VLFKLCCCVVKKMLCDDDKKKEMLDLTWTLLIYLSVSEDSILLYKQNTSK